MTDQDAVQMMQRCVSELKQLRQANNELAPSAHAYDTIAVLVRLLAPPQSQGYAEDLVYKLEREIEKLSSDKEKTNG